ncbi:MAG: hypothetical protein ACI89D_002162 [Bermanella sp.]|jgi:hypothetical protein
MAEVLLQKDYKFSADTVWALLSNFGDISWAPGMDKVEVIGEGLGMTRRIHMAGMEPIDEVLQAMDHDAMSFSYTIPSGIPMPVTDYTAGPTVVSTGPDSCRVDWRGSATPVGVSDEEATEIIKGFYTMLLQWVDEHLQAQ